MLNAHGWITVAAALKLGQPSEALIFSVFLPLMLILSFPIATLFLLPGLGPPTTSEMVTLAVAIGLNTVVWGHGLAWLIERVRGKKLPKLNVSTE